MTAFELLQALKALPRGARHALAFALLRDDGGVTPAETDASPIDTSRAWPVFTSPLLGEGSTETFDHRMLRESRIDELVERVLGENRI